MSKRNYRKEYSEYKDTSWVAWVWVFIIVPAFFTWRYLEICWGF